MVHIDNGILLSQKRNTIESVLMRWINLEPVIESEVSQKEKNKYCIQPRGGKGPGNKKGRDCMGMAWDIQTYRCGRDIHGHRKRMQRDMRTD